MHCTSTLYSKGICAAGLLAAVLSPGLALAELTIVAEGLDNPRGISFDARGALYVVEAGRGGEGPPCAPGPDGRTVCYGETGAITRVWKGVQERIVEGLPSLAGPDGGTAIGPNDISHQGVGGALVTIGLGNDPSVRDTELAPVGHGFGIMIQVSASGAIKFAFDVAAHELAENPEPAHVDSNPYSVVNLPGGAVVADAGANAVLWVDQSGEILTMEVFGPELVPAPPFLGLPPGAKIPMEAVPNCVAQGPDGSIFVGQLTGFPFPVGGAKVYRLLPGGGREVVSDGFTNIVDIDLDDDGNLYVLEYARYSMLSGNLTGALTKVAPDGTKVELASQGLVAPTSVAVGPDGAPYVSNFGIFPDIGTVVRVDP